jgi:hypothetical protein
VFDSLGAPFDSFATLFNDLGAPFIILAVGCSIIPAFTVDTKSIQVQTMKAIWLLLLGQHQNTSNR